jgi:hypothetical protein
MARGHPGNALLRVGDDIWEPLGRDPEQSHRLIRRVRERVQPFRAFGKVDDVPAESCSSPCGVRTVGVPLSTKNISSRP